jgi:hypothetical protein
MTRRPILFSRPMVKALLAGTKTQTRRIAKPLRTSPLPRDDGYTFAMDGEGFGGLTKQHLGGMSIFPLPRSPYGVPGDRLWVRETFCYSDGHASPKGEPCYRANLPDKEYTGWKWKPSIFMRRRDSRITLEIVDVDFQHLQGISDADAKAEGVPNCYAYASLWDSINGAGSWETNPWVWVISFRRLP